MNSTSSCSPSALGARAPRALAALVFVFAALLARTGLCLGPTIGAPFPIALKGQTAPAGGVYSIFNLPVLSDSGQVSFFAYVDNGVTLGGGSFVGLPGSLQPAAMLNTPAPAGGIFSNFSTSVVNNAGQVAIRSSLIGGSSTQGLYFGTPGSLQTLARENTAAPGGGKFSNFPSEPLLNDLGQVAFLADLSTPSGTAIFSGSVGSLQVVAKTGTPSPVGGSFQGFEGAPVMNASGKVAFTALLSGTTANRGVFVGTPGTLQTAALQGTAAPAGGNFATMYEPALNDAGQVAFTSTLTGGSSTEGMFSGLPGTLQTVALMGAAAPGGGNYVGFTNPAILNGPGQVAYKAYVSGALNAQGIFAGKPGSIQSVARRNGSAPSGGLYDELDFPVLNGLGQVAFTSTLFGSGVTTANDLALYAGVPGTLFKVVRKGDAVDVDPGIGIDLRIVNDIDFANFSGGQDGDFLSLGDSGVIAYQLGFTDGSNGIFTSVVPIPEPGTIGVFAAGFLGLVALRRQRGSVRN